jgi:TolB-like protein
MYVLGKTKTTEKFKNSNQTSPSNPSIRICSFRCFSKMTDRQWVAKALSVLELKS